MDAKGDLVRGNDNNISVREPHLLVFSYASFVCVCVCICFHACALGRGTYMVRHGVLGGKVAALWVEWVECKLEQGGMRMGGRLGWRREGHLYCSGLCKVG